MKRSIAVVFLFVAGCGANPDTAAVEKYLRSTYSNVDVLQIEPIEAPEYVTVSKVPNSHRSKPSDKPAVCGVRVRFHWKTGNRTTHDEQIVWVTGDHQAVDWSGNPEGDNWRKYVRTLAKK
jgi:cysteine synthase